MPRESSFQNFQEQPSGVAQGLVDSTRPPVRKYDVNRVLKEYKLGKTKVRGKSDAALYKVARKAVIDWFERQQKAKAAAKKRRQRQKKRARNQTRQFNQAVRNLQAASAQPQAPTAPARQPRPKAAPKPNPATVVRNTTRSPGGYFIP